MDKLTAFFIAHRRGFWLGLLVSCAVSAVLLLTVNVNYDLAEYLPEDSMTSKAIAKTQDSFGYPSMCDVMLEDVTVAEALEFKAALAAVDGVSGVLWLDDLADVSRPIELLSQNLLNTYYRDGAALFSVSFSDGDYSQRTYAALDAIRALRDGVRISGAANGSAATARAMAPEIIKIILIVIPICELLLMFASTSWLEPAMVLFVIGISILWNMATNAFLPSVSFITHSLAAVIQLAVAMDYSLFYYHRYTEERRDGLDVLPALKKTARKTVVSITASALTTVAGFLALFFMRYSIGSDFGLVLAKGIAFSFISVNIFMPILISTFHRTLERTTHRPFIPSFAGLAKLVIRFRYALIPLFIVVLVPAFLAQQRVEYYYGDSAASSKQGGIASDANAIAERFGINNPVLLMVPDGNLAAEIAMSDELAQNPHIHRIYSLTELADPAIPRALYGDTVLSQFISNGYVRVIVYINAETETAECDSAVAAINAAAEKYYPGEWLAAGKATSISDIRDTVQVDGLKVTLFSLLFVGFVVLVSFRSISIPVLLLAVIEASVIVNMGIPYFSGNKLIYIGYLVVSSMQLGATIDYAILMTNRYMDNRAALIPPRESAIASISTAGTSVTISALILATAGYTEGLVSNMPSIGEIGALLGRGALLSLVMVILVLPTLLVLFDSLIRKTTYLGRISK